MSLFTTVRTVWGNMEISWASVFAHTAPNLVLAEIAENARGYVHLSRPEARLDDGWPSISEIPGLLSSTTADTSQKCTHKTKYYHSHTLLKPFSVCPSPSTTFSIESTHTPSHAPTIALLNCPLILAPLRFESLPQGAADPGPDSNTCQQCQEGNT